MPRVPYLKPYVPIPGQIDLLKRRGMTISDEARAAQYLERIGYYRLSGYWHVCRETEAYRDGEGKDRLRPTNRFRPGTEFQHAVDLYVFDKRLRLLFLDAIERIEVAMRVAIALRVGNRSPLAHREPAQLHGNFTKVNPKTGKIRHQVWLTRLNKQENDSREDFVTHFRETYTGELPIWIAIELWDFGLLSHFFAGLKAADQDALATRYGVPSGTMLATWLRAINNVRNICAHHSRLWNRSPADQPRLPRPGEVALLDHLADPSQHRFAREHVYAAAAVIQFLMRTINPTSSWANRLKTEFERFPTCRNITVAQTSFPAGWESLPLWS